MQNPHAASFARLLDDSSDWGLPALVDLGVRTGWPVGAGPALVVDDVTASAPPPPDIGLRGPRSVRVTARIAVEGAQEQRRTVLRLPVVEDDGTLWWRGRRLAPLGLLRERPGAWPHAWVPLIGPAVRLRRDSGSVMLGVDGLGQATVDEVRTALVTGDATAGALRRHLDAGAGLALPGAPDVLSWLAGVGLHVPPGPGADLDRLRILLAGQHLALAVLVGVRRGAAAAHRALGGTGQRSRVSLADPAALVADSLDSATATALGRVLAPSSRDGEGGRFAGADDTNPLALLEQTRTVSFMGPDGIGARAVGAEQLRRDTHPSYAGRLCPLSTRESTAVGLVRVLALGARLDGDGIFADAVPEEGDWRSRLGPGPALMPFLCHDDPVRAVIGAKNLKQFVPLVAAEAPLVATGIERELAAALPGVVAVPPGRRVRVAGMARAGSPLRQEDLDDVDVPEAPVRLRSAPDRPTTSGTDDTLRAARRGYVVEGGVFGLPPGALAGADGTTLAPGRNCLVALTPLDGLGVEDAIIVSRSCARAFTSEHLEEVVATAPPGGQVDITIAALVGNQVSRGQPVLVVRYPDGRRREVPAPRSGLVEAVTHRPGPAGAPQTAVLVRVPRALEVGDKMTGRHGNKGIVGAVLDDGEMPQVRLPSGIRPADVVLNPLGLLRRKTLGVLAELHWGLVALVRGEPLVAPPFGRSAADGLAEALAELGRPDGRLPVTIGDRTVDVVVGIHYLVKLNHLADHKLQALRTGRASPRTGQPSRARRPAAAGRDGRAQRLGEMELWALQASGADTVLRDALLDRRGQRKGDVPETLRVVLDVLAAAGLRARLGYAGADEVDATDAAAVDELEWEVGAGLRFTLAETDRLLDQLPAPAPLISPDPVRERHQAAAGAPPAAGGFFDPQLWPVGAGDHVMAHVELLRPVVHPWFESTARQVWSLDEPESWPRDADPYAIYRAAAGAVPVDDVPPPPNWPRPDDASSPWQRARALALQGLLLRWLTVLPAAHRWDVALVGGAVVRSDLQRRYDAVVEANARAATDGGPAATAHLRRAVADLFGPASGRDAPPDSLAGMLRGKQGLLRRHLLGTSVWSSARAVMAPDPLLGLEQVGLPAEVLTELGLVAGDVVVVNRQPTLQRTGLVALRVVPTAPRAVLLHPALIGPLAGDFDGDEVNVHVPSRGRAAEQAWALLRPARNLATPRVEEPVVWHAQDVALGEQRLSSYAQRVAAIAERLRRSGQEDLQPLHDAYSAAFTAATGGAAVSLPDLHALRDGFAHPAVAEAEAGGFGSRAQQECLEPRDVVDTYTGRATVQHRVPAEGTLLDGLPLASYEQLARQALTALGDKKLGAPAAGDLTKRLVEALYDVELVPDCGTSARLPTSALSARAQRRAQPDGVRSPLLCAAVPAEAHVCTACYGPDVVRPGPLPLGARVGLTAAQSIGERATQLVLKAIHSGVRQADLSVVEAVLAGRSVHAPVHDDDAGCWPGEPQQTSRDQLWGGTSLCAVQALRWCYTSPDRAALPGSVPDVDDVHLELVVAVLRRYLDGGGALLARAVADQPPLARATTRGDVRPLLQAALGGEQWILDRRKERLAAGLVQGESS